MGAGAGFDEERFLNHYRAKQHGMPVRQDSDGFYRLADNYLIQHKKDKELFDVFGTQLPTSLISEQGANPIEFTPLGEYIKQRQQGKNDFGREYVESVYSGLGKMGQATTLSQGAAYDKILLEDSMMPMTERIQEFYKNNIFNKIDEVKGLGPVLTETLTQYVVPYIGARQLTKKLVSTPLVQGIFKKALKNAKAKKLAEDTVIGTGAIGGMSAVAVNPGDENAMKFIIEGLGLPEGEAGTLYNNMYEYFTSVEDANGGADADAVVREKVRAFFGDLPLEAALVGGINTFKIVGKNVPAVRLLGNLMLLTKALMEGKGLTVEQIKRLEEAATLRN
tara:strand:+ start:2616 stop:3620 length:1005 start_codon:yes stop_codon:yes gene_type:complete